MRRTAVFVDHANLNACVRNRGLEVDYYDLKDYLAQEQEGRMPLEAFCYVAIDPRNEHRLDREILRMQEDGWLVKTKMGAPRPDGGFKCNVDVEMAIDVIAFTYDAKPDIVVIVSGDQDFAAVVRKLRERGVRVEVAAFPENVSHILLNEASGFINLEKYFEEAGRFHESDDGSESGGGPKAGESEPFFKKFRKILKKDDKEGDGSEDYEPDDDVCDEDADGLREECTRDIPRSMDYF